MTLLEQATDLQQKAAGPDIFDAVDTYYADDVTIVEATGETFHGRETQKGRIREFLSDVETLHGGEIRALAAHETAPGSGVVFAESATDATFKEGGRMTLEEVAVQQWRDGRVVHERFYYNAPGA
jgi:ketosteroid isomerase-like protein